MVFLTPVKWLLSRLARKRYERAGEPLRTRLPGKAEGIEDGFEGGSGVGHRLGKFEPVVEQERSDTINPLDAEYDLLQGQLKDAIEEQHRLKKEIDEIGPDVPSAVSAAIYAGAICVVGFSEATILKPMMPVFGDHGFIGQWILALAFSFGPAFLLKLAVSPKRPLLSGLAPLVMRWAALAICPMAVIAFAIYRSAHISIVTSSQYEGGVMAQLYQEHGWVIIGALILMSLCIMGFTTFAWDMVDDYWKVHYRLYKIHRARVRSQHINKRLALIPHWKISREKRIQGVADEKRADYLHAVATTPRKRNSEYHSAKVVLLALMFLGIGAALSSAVYHLALKFGMSDIESVALAGGLTLAFVTGGMFFGLSYAKQNSTANQNAQLVLPLAMGLLVVAIPATTSCSTPRKSEKLHVALMLDETKSVNATDEELVAASINIASRLPRCSDLTITPINARAGSTYEFKVPCEDVPYDDDLKAPHKRLLVALPALVADWRKAEAFSNYKDALTLAAERLDQRSNTILIILGDLIDDRGRASPDKAKLPPEVPPLPRIGFHKAKTYIGLLDSNALDRLSIEGRTQFEKNLRIGFVAAGVNDYELTLRAFGLQGLDAWADAVIGPVNPVYRDGHGTKK